MRSKLKVTAWIVLAFAGAIGCDRRVSTEPDTYIGEYVFTSNADPGHFASFIILKKDQSTLEVRYSKKTGEVQTTLGKWKLSPYIAGHLDIDDFSHPIDRSSSGIRLIINDDLDEYYEKIR